MFLKKMINLVLLSPSVVILPSRNDLLSWFGLSKSVSGLYFDLTSTHTLHCMLVLYCIVSIHLYSASCSAHQSEALPVRETQREESSLERTKRGTWLTS